jgi:hypothetical protein
MLYPDTDWMSPNFYFEKIWQQLHKNIIGDHSFQDITSILNREESTKKLSKNKTCGKKKGETLGTPPSSFPSCFSLSTCISLCSREATKSYNFNFLNRDCSLFFNTWTSLCSREALNHTILTSSVETAFCFSTPEPASALGRPLNHTILTSTIETTACFSTLQ